jgi:hypothetical protein
MHGLSTDTTVLWRRQQPVTHREQLPQHTAPAGLPPCVQTPLITPAIPTNASSNISVQISMPVT